MTNLLLNIAPHTFLQGQALTEGRGRAVGRPLFVVGPAAAVTGEAPGTNGLRFDAMLLDAHAPLLPGAIDTGALLQPQKDADSAESAESLAEELTPCGAVPLQNTIVAPTEFAKKVSSAPVPNALAGSAAPVPTMSANFVAGQALAVQDILAPTLQGAVTVSTHEASANAASAALSFAAGSSMAAPPRGEVGQIVSESAPLQLASQSVASAAATLAVFANDAPMASIADSHGNVARQPLAALLGERLQVQIGQRSEHAVVRLDPPYMGTIEIIIRQEAGQLHVQLRASNSEVARQLHVIGETLRQDLVQRQHGDVSVQVSDSREGEQRQRQQRASQQWQEEPGRALSEADEEHGAFTMNAASE